MTEMKGLIQKEKEREKIKKEKDEKDQRFGRKNGKKRKGD